MLASSTPFHIHDENAVHKSSMKSVSKRVFYEDDETPQKAGKIGQSIKSVGRRALGDLSSSQVNQRLTLAITPATTKGGLGIKPLTGGQKLKTLVFSENVTDSVIKPSKAKDQKAAPISSQSVVASQADAIAQLEDDEFPLDAAEFVCTRASKQPTDVYDLVMAKSESIHYVITTDQYREIAEHSFDNSWMTPVAADHPHNEDDGRQSSPPMLQNELDLVEW